MKDERHPTGLLLVRFKPGVVGEVKRVVHIVPTPDANADGIPATLTAYCGQRIGPGQADLLAGIGGMPCDLCVARTPFPVAMAVDGVSGNAALPAGGGDR